MERQLQNPLCPVSYALPSHVSLANQKKMYLKDMKNLRCKSEKHVLQDFTPNDEISMFGVYEAGMPAVF